MKNNSQLSLRAARIMFMLVVLASGTMVHAQAAHKAAASATSAPTMQSSEPPEVTRNTLLRLLRMTPTLTAVVARDPSLLGDREYISHTNPELEQFLQEHPAVVRNPEFYLFANLSKPGTEDRVQGLQREVWPEMLTNSRRAIGLDWQIPLFLFLFWIFALGLIAWLIRRILEHRRWSQAFKLQVDTHNKLMDRFSSNEQLLAYMSSEAGKRFLESTPVRLDSGSTATNPMAKVLTPLQLGVILTLVGSGFLFLRGSAPEPAISFLFLLLATLMLMLGFGFIISAALSLGLAHHFGLLPEKSKDRSADDSHVDAKSSV